MTTPPDPFVNVSEVQINIGGEPVSDLALMVLVHDWCTVNTFPSRLGLELSFDQAANQLRKIATEIALDPDQDYPFVDELGEWEVKFDGTPIPGFELALVQCHDGGYAMALGRRADGSSLDPLAAAECLRNNADVIEHRPDFVIGSDGPAT